MCISNSANTKRNVEVKYFSDSACTQLVTKNVVAIQAQPQMCVISNGVLFSDIQNQQVTMSMYFSRFCDGFSKNTTYQIGECTQSDDLFLLASENM